MAIARNRALSDGASSACFEVVGSGEEAATTIITVADLEGAGADDNQSIIVKRVVATVASSGGGLGYVTLSWGDGTDFLHLPNGVTDIEIPFEHNVVGGGDADIKITSPADSLFTVRIFANKVTGFPLSMGHSRNRP
mgnify:FL=1